MQFITAIMENGRQSAQKKKKKDLLYDQPFQVWYLPKHIEVSMSEGQLACHVGCGVTHRCQGANLSAHGWMGHGEGVVVHTRAFLSISFKERGNPVVFNNIDGARECHAE